MVGGCWKWGPKLAVVVDEETEGTCATLEMEEGKKVAEVWQEVKNVVGFYTESNPHRT